VVDLRADGCYEIMQPSYNSHAMHRLFAGIVEHAFCAEVGVCDPRLLDYLVMMLIDFVHVDHLYRVRDADGNRVENISDMLAVGRDMLTRDDRLASRDFHRYIGDYALFWTGVFPEGLRRPSKSPNPNRFAEYIDRGKSSYAIASDLYGEDTDPPGSLFRRLSAEFEVCVHGLILVRRAWENNRLNVPPAGDGPHPQAED